MAEVDWASFKTRLRRYVGSRVEPLWVDDVVGDILLRLVQHRDSLTAAGNPLAFVLRVATNAITDHYRRKSVEHRGLAEFEIENAEDAVIDHQASDQARRDIANCVLPFVQALPEIYRDALLLTEFEGLTQRESARRLGVSISGMKSRVQRGRTRLKHALLRCCVVEVDRLGGVVDYERRAAGCCED